MEGVGMGCRESALATLENAIVFTIRASSRCHGIVNGDHSGILAMAL